jgi:iron complex outermembrane recepter protein
MYYNNLKPLGRACLSALFIFYSLTSVQAQPSTEKNPVRGTSLTEPTNEPILIKGKVVDKRRVSLPGVAIMVQGTATGTITDVYGYYSLKTTQSNPILQFSMWGYTTQEAVLRGRSELNIIMRDSLEGFAEMVVTTGRQAVRRLEATSSINIADGRELLAKMPATIADALRYTPGVYAVSQRGRVRSSVVMRGFPEDLSAGDRYSAFLIDGLSAFPGSGNATDQFYIPDLNLERIEVVRGASATLFGRNSAAGVYNAILKTGGEKLQGIVQQTYSPSPANPGQMWQTGANLNGPLSASKAWRFNLGGFYLHDPGYRLQIKPDRGYQARANVDYLGKRLNLRIYGMSRNLDLAHSVDVPFDPKTLAIMPGFTNRWALFSPGLYDLNYTRPTGVTVNTIPGVVGDRANVRTGNVGVDNEPMNFTKGYNFGLRSSLDLGRGFSVQNHFRYQQMQTGSNVLVGANYTRLFAVGIFNSSGHRDLQDVVNELILKKEVKIGRANHIFSLGGYYSWFRQDIHSAGFVYTLDLSNPELVTVNRPGILSHILNGNNSEARVINQAVFLGDEIDFGKLKVNLGARLDYGKLDLLTYLHKSSNGQLNGPTFPSQFVDQRVIDLDGISGTMSFNYLLGKTASLYGNLVRGFRAPDEATFLPLVRTPEEPVNRYANATPLAESDQRWAVNVNQPEIIHNAEFGFRRGREELIIDVAVFGSDIQNRLTSTLTEVTPGSINTVAVSQGTIRIYGAEAAINYTPFALPGLDLKTNFTFQRSLYQSFQNFAYDNRPTTPVAQRTRDVSGNRVKNNPGFMWNWLANYERRFGRAIFGLSVDGNYVADRYAEEANVIKLPNVLLLGATLTCRAKVGRFDDSQNQLALSWHIQNLTDVQAMQWMVDLSPIGTMQGANWAALPGVPYLPRRSFITLSYSF